MAGPLMFDRVRDTTTTTGTGTVTLTNSAPAGFRTFGSVLSNSDTVWYTIAHQSLTEWEVGIGTYTTSGTTLARTTILASSNAGAAVSFSAGPKDVFVTIPAQLMSETVKKGTEPGGRLTLTTGVPVITSDVATSTNIFYTPWKNNQIELWNGTYWAAYTFSEITLALGTLTTTSNYDVFAYISSGAVTLEILIWTNATTRATAVTLQDGRYCKSGDKTRLYIGTFRTISTTQTCDIADTVNIWNAYNRVPRRVYHHLVVGGGLETYTYATATWRSANGDSANRITVLAGRPESLLFLSASILFISTSTSVFGTPGIGEDSTTVNTCDLNGRAGGVASGSQLPTVAIKTCRPAVGLHTYNQIEIADGGTAVFGSTTTDRFISGIGGWWEY